VGWVVNSRQYPNGSTLCGVEPFTRPIKSECSFCEKMSPTRTSGGFLLGSSSRSRVKSLFFTQSGGFFLREAIGGVKRLVPRSGFLPRDADAPHPLEVRRHRFSQKRIRRSLYHLYLNVDARRKIQIRERFNYLRVGVQDLDQALVDAEFELLAGVLMDKR